MTRRTPSFRTRIFFVSMLIVSLILATVAVASWSSAMAYEVDRLDTRLCEEARRFASPAMQFDQLGRLESDVYFKLRLQSPDQLLLWLQPAPASSPLRSQAWPSGLMPTALAWRAIRDQSAVAEPDGAAGQAVDGRDHRPHPLCEVTGFQALGSDWRAAKVMTKGGLSLVAADLAAIRAELGAGLVRLGWRIGPLALALAALGAWLMSASAMRPVARLRRTMELIHQKSLKERLPADREDREFQDLIEAYNQMLERLETSFKQATRFSADAAHELRTPLTVLQGQIEHAMRLSADQPIQVQLSQMLDETGRLSSITRKLLLLSQADAGELALHRVAVDISSMLEERLADVQDVRQDVLVSVALIQGAIVHGDPQLLTQVLNNLCSNAIKYTPPAGWIKVDACLSNEGLAICWANSAELALEPIERERLFDRFYRGDASHNRRIDGHGLGLSLSRVIARAHGGDLTLEPSPLNEVRMRLWLPNPQGPVAR